MARKYLSQSLLLLPLLFLSCGSMSAGTLSAGLWPSTAAPGTVDDGDSSAVEIGVKFTSSTAGSIIGVRFYKSSNNTGTHVGNLWTSGGTLLASATFTSETASGWQTVIFAQPVVIQANITYVASYHTNVGHYSDDQNYFAAAYSAAPLQVPPGGGVYVYGANSAFPTQVWNASNYWVDIILQYGSTSTSTVAVSVLPTTASLASGGTQQFTATVSGTMNNGVTWSATGGTISPNGLYTAPTTPGTYTVTATSTADTTKSAAATVTVTAPSVVAVSISPTSSSLQTGGAQQFTATVTGTSNTAVAWAATGGSISSSGQYTAPNTGGSYTVTVTSAADTTKSASATVNISAPAGLSASLWPSSAVPGTVDDGDGSAVEIGVKFTSSATGSITGVKFYKSSNNTGAHLGNLWTSSGTLLASAMFTNETAFGWQTAVFAQPVAIQANTIYVASYHTNVGHYSDDQNYFAAAYSASPLQVPPGGGVYVYGANSAFPTQVWNASNYWVDIILQYGSTSTRTSTVAVSVSPTTASLATSGTQQFTATVTGASNTTVTWSATGGTISSNGLYIAPTMAGTYTVKATSAADTTKAASSTVMVSAAVTHSATLSWIASTSSAVGYNVYRAMQSGGPYTVINTALQPATTYADLSVQAGQTYYYVVTAVSSSGAESIYSNQVTAVVP